MENLQREESNLSLRKVGSAVSPSKKSINESNLMANGRFMITKSIGKGSFGEIFQGIDMMSHKEVAIKMVLTSLLYPHSFRNTNTAKSKCSHQKQKYSNNYKD